MLILPATRVLVLGSRCLDLGTVGEGQGRLTAEMGQFVGRGDDMGEGNTVRTRSPLVSLPRVVATNFLGTPFLWPLIFRPQVN
jgi:hypothetical protein